ncbi:MAG: YHS domain-containing protein [Geobacter sp.]|nr:MAG: YHS domain-containing protein [Geobacter sp.]
MERDHTLIEKIIERFQRHGNKLADEQRKLDSEMMALLEQRKRLKATAKDKLDRIILPRMAELAQQFDNAKVEVLDTEAGYTCLCKFLHIPRFPATVRLGISLFSEDGRGIFIRYDLSILPVLMEYKPNFQEVFACDDDDSLGQWVNDRILDFVDVYLQLETHPLYQKENAVIDVVCGMRISSISAACTIESHGRTFYFCSEHCKDAFSRDMANFIKKEGDK